MFKKRVLLEYCIKYNINLKTINVFNKKIDISNSKLDVENFCKLVKIYSDKTKPNRYIEMEFTTEYISNKLLHALVLEDKKYAKFIYHTFKNQVGDFIKPLLKEI